VIVLDVIAVVLAIASVGYLVYAMFRAEKF
jgi:K+-transporting ATPase KdpF subunit